MQQHDSSTAEQRRHARRDVIGHSGVQPWSAGEIFPCVIARTERYGEQRRYKLETFNRDWQRGEVYAIASSIREALHLVMMDERLKRAGVIDEEPIGAPSVSYELIAYGHSEEYASREDAERVARALNADPELRKEWRGEPTANRMPAMCWLEREGS